MVQTCFVPGCRNRATKKPPGCTLHRFPKNRERRLAWSKAVRGDGHEASDKSCICSDHFEERMFDRTGQTTRLREFAFPTIFPVPQQIPEKTRRRIHKFSSNKYANPVPKLAAGPIKKCVFSNCESNSEFYGMDYMKNIFFVPVPSTKCDVEKRRLWLESSRRSDLITGSSTDQFKYYLCSKHFVDGVGPTADHPDPIPYEEMSDQATTETGSYFSFGSAMEISNEEQINHSEVLESSHFPGKSFVMSRLCDKSSPQHYVITVKKLPSLSSDPYSICDIRANYRVPKDWTFCMTDSTVFFTTMNNETDCLLMKFVINEDMTTSLQALGRNLRENHPLFVAFPKMVSSEETLNKCFSVLSDYRPCYGNNEKAYVSYFKQRNKTIRAVYNPRSAAVHSILCELLTKEKNSRCFACQLLRHVLRSRLETYLEKFGIFNESQVGNGVQKDINDQELK